MDADRLLIALAADHSLDREVLCLLARRMEAWCQALPADAKSLAPHLGVPASSLRLALRIRDGGCPGADEALGRAQEIGSRLVTLRDPAYPAALLDLPRPPAVLHVAGELPRRPAVAIVGAREADAYGIEVAVLFGRELAARGLTIVSGLARGVDTAAHRGALEAEGGTTVAVLGAGLDVDYPRGHGRLRRRIARRGALVSEYPPGTPPRAWQFPVRNRIIAALVSGVLVVQAAARSGSLVTARLALDLGRDVWAVPAPIFHRRAVGPNTLIRDGALAVQSPRDVVEALPDAVRRSLLPAGTTARAAVPPGDPAHLLSLLEVGTSYDAESLAGVSGWPLDRVLAALLELEIADHLQRLPGPVWRRRP